MTDTCAVENENDLLTHYFANRDISCPTCGYNLRDLRGDHCPECGQTLEIVLRNHSDVSVQWVWAFSASCLAVPIGMTVLGVSSFIKSYQWPAIPPYDIDWLKIIFAAAYLIGMLPGLDMLVTRQRFIRYSFTKQEWVARGIILYQVIVLSLFLGILLINHL